MNCTRALALVATGLFATAGHAQLQRELQSPNLGTYAWGASYGYDVDDDGTPNLWTRDSGRITVYRGLSPWWTVSFGTYTYPYVVTPRDVDGDGLIKPVNIDADASGEVVMTAYRISGSTWSGRIRVYDAASRQLEWESTELPGFSGAASVDDVDGDGKHEVIITRYDYSGGWGYVEVYGHVGAGTDGREQFGLEASGPSARPAVTSGPATLRFSLSGPAQTRLQVLDATGRVMRNLLAAELPPGEYDIRWDGFDDRGDLVPAGSYLYRLTRGDKVSTGRVVVAR